MSTFRNPVGPQSPRVYWRRRLALALGVLAVIVIVVLIVVRPGAGAEEPKSKSGSSSSESAKPSAPAAKPGDPCAPQNVKLDAVTDQDLYAAGAQPQLSMLVTNIGAVACALDVTPTLQVLTVTSGAETYWLSSDCQVPPAEGSEPVTVILEPNKPQPTAPLAWDRTRSSTTTCEASRPAVPGGDSTYALQVKIGEIESEKKAFRLL
jgi:hypothetical protein